MLIFYHLEEHVSARHMLQVLEQDDFARENIVPQDGIKKAASPILIVFEKLSRKASGTLPNPHPELNSAILLLLMVL